MWIVRWTFIALVVLAILGFSLQNAAIVEVTLWTWHSGQIPLYLVAYCAFACGVILALVATLYKQIQHQITRRQLRNEVKRLQVELDRMRTISLDEGLEDEPPPTRAPESR